MTKKSIVLVLVLVIVAVVAGYWSRGLLAVKMVPSVNSGPTPVTTNTTTTATTTSSAPTYLDQPKFEPKVISTNEQPSVVWQEPQKLSDLNFLIIPDYGFGGEAKYYQVGKITSGKYSGSSVILAEVYQEMGPAVLFHFIQYQDSYVLLKKHSPDWLPSGKNYSVDDTLTLGDLNYPTKFTNDSQSYSLEENYNNFPFFDSNYLKPMFTVPKLGQVYVDATSSQEHRARNGFYLKAPDGTLRTYTLDIPFYDPKTHLPTLTWNNGQQNTVEYSPAQLYGCGARNFVMVETNLKLSDIKAAGKTSTGETIYESVGTNPLIADLYRSSRDLYENKQLTLDQFIAKYPHPFFYWFDPFGRLIRFQRLDFQPAAECGKPVIYLYPTETTKVSVQLDPQGGFTKSEPAYGKGWEVIATPASELTNLVDGKSYPYLFWEGRGGIYETPKKGFVIKASEVHSFLVEKLTALGLNEQERADFIEFWEPRMTGSPYFFVTFMGNQIMNQIAPLKVTPNPDTVIRILMDFLPLAAPIEVEGFNIKTPVRQGFTVVEWGGVIR
jgi:hypothetical protein